MREISDGEFGRRFDGGEDVMDYVDTSQARRPNRERAARRIRVPVSHSRRTMRFTCEFELEECEGAVVAWAFWPGRCDGTVGDDERDAELKAADWLRELLASEVASGRVPAFPLGNDPVRGGRVVPVTAEVSERDVARAEPGGTFVLVPNRDEIPDKLVRAIYTMAGIDPDEVDAKAE